MSKIRPGTAADYEVVMERVFASFAENNPTHPRFEGLCPDTGGPSEEVMNQWLLAEVDGEIAAGMQIVPRPMLVAGMQVPASGLGNVFCYQPFRKQGHMSALLHATNRKTAEAGYALCMLGGDRLRYGRFGWEHAGSARSLALSKAMIRGEPQIGIGPMELTRWLGQREHTERMLAAYNRLPYRTVRTSVEEFERVLQRPGQCIWIRDDAEHGFAYVSLRGTRIAEYAGDVAALRQILQYLLRNRDHEIDLPPVEEETVLERMFLEHAQRFSTVPVGMVRLVLLRQTLLAFEPLLTQRLAGWRGRFSLVTTEPDEEVTIVGDGKTLRFAPETGPNPLVLARQEMVRLLFGPFPPNCGDRQQEPFLRRAFPLPLYWHSLSRV